MVWVQIEKFILKRQFLRVLGVILDVGQPFTGQLKVFFLLVFRVRSFFRVET